MTASATTDDHRLQRIGSYALCLADDRRILLSRYTSGTWGLPGGGVDHGEHPEDAVAREVAEETGFDVRVDNLLGIHSKTWHTETRLHVHAVSLVYRVEVIGGQLRHEIDGSSDQAAWISTDELDQIPHTDLIDIVVRDTVPAEPGRDIRLPLRW